MYVCIQYIYVCVYIYIYIHIYIFVYIYIYIYILYREVERDGMGIPLVKTNYFPN